MIISSGYINFYKNQLTGTIPSDMRLRQLFYFDLGRNKFSGTLPADIGDKYIRLRHLHLDHNQFVGTIPPTYTQAGNGRLESLSLNSNLLTGSVPTNYELYHKLGTWWFNKSRCLETFAKMINLTLQFYIYFVCHSFLYDSR